MMRKVGTGMLALALLAALSDTPANINDRLWQHRNLGKAYYENPMTQVKAVEEFKQAVVLSQESVRDEVNYGLALLRAGMAKDAIAELVKAQKKDPSIPHTWFNLGMAYKKQFDNQKAIEQFEGMLRLVPDEPVTHYNLGVVTKLTGKSEEAQSHFKSAAQLDPNFAAPHFQLYNAYREGGKNDEAGRELALFNEIKKRKAGAAVAEDPEWNIYSEIYDVVELDGQFDKAETSPPFVFRVKEVASGVDPSTAGLLGLDLEGNGQSDLLVWSDRGIVVLKNGSTALAHSGLENVKGVVTVAAGDFNNDGLPDLAVVTNTGAALYINRKGRFEVADTELPTGNFTKAIWLDYDHDYDLDLLLLGEKSLLLRNDGKAGFSDQTVRFPFVNGNVSDALMFELFPNNDETDLAVLYVSGEMVIYHDKLGGAFEARRVPAIGNHGFAVRAADVNNDGWTDLVVSASTGINVLINDKGNFKADVVAAGGQPSFALADLANRGLPDLVVGRSVFRNMGRRQFENANAEALPATAALLSADFDGDGQSDLAGLTKDGQVLLLKNETAIKNNSLKVQLEGVKNLKLPIGAIVEVKAGAWYQKQMYAGVPLLFGLRAYSEVDTVRIIWPNGLVQNEIKQPAGKGFLYKEKARLSGSCPMIFVWNGSSYSFITDVLGVAPLGARSGDGQYFPVNHREHIMVPAQVLKPTDGEYEVRITEELREVSYLDTVKLLAIDHLSGSTIYTSDKFSGPPFTKFRLYAINQRNYPVAVRDDRGHDLLDRVIHADGRYIDTFRRYSNGMADLHKITLDFGKAAPTGRTLLVLNGWVDWPDGSTMLAAQQEDHDGAVFPYLQVKDRSGTWRTVVSDMGLPSGKPKSIVVDLTGKFLSASREVRIVTNLCLYWDEAYLSDDTQRPAVKVTPLQTTLADLRYRGFSKVTVAANRTAPEAFDYEQWSPVTAWNPTPGMYTRYGDVRALLAKQDDQLVIMGSGDELALRFGPKQLPPLAPGWDRDFVLLVDGWAKDSDANTAYGRSVTPLPFHGMASYPYPAPQHFPNDPDHQAYQRRFNTRHAIDNLAPMAQVR